MTVWDDFWKWAETSQLGANVVGGILVAAIIASASVLVSVLRKSWRDKVWGGSAKLIEWLWAHRLRVTTEQRYRDAIRRAKWDGARVVTSATSQDRTTGSIDIAQPGSIAGAPIEVAGPETMLNNLRRGVRVFGDAVEAATKLPPKDPDPVVNMAVAQLPLPRPRWSVFPSPHNDADFGAYMLRNAVPRSVAREVRLEGDADFAVTDAGHWEDLSGPSSGDFRGNITLTGTRLGVTFRIAWYDEDGILCSEPYYMPGRGDVPF